MRLVDSRHRTVIAAPDTVGGIVKVADEDYRLAPGETVRLRYDLARLFRIVEPGRYTLRFEDDGAVLAEAAFDVKGYRAVASRRVSGTYHPPYIGSPPNVVHNTSATISIVETTGTPSGVRYLVIDEVKVGDEARKFLPAYAYPVLPETTVERAEMDYLGQIWLLLKSGDRNSLLIWRVHDLSWSELVAPTDRGITFGTTRARAFVDGQTVVIAGVEGREKFSSYSVCSYLVGGGYATNHASIPRVD